MILSAAPGAAGAPTQSAVRWRLSSRHLLAIPSATSDNSKSPAERRDIEYYNEKVHLYSPLNEHRIVLVMSGGVQDPLQLVSRSFLRVREQCVAVIYPIGHRLVTDWSHTGRQ